MTDVSEVTGVSERITPLGWRDEWRRVDSRWGPMIVNRYDQYVGWSLMAYGEFSRDEVEFLRGLVEPGDTVIDIGANLGALTLPLADKVGPTGRVIAFEPQARMFELLVLNRGEDRPWIDPRCCAVGAAPSQLRVPLLDYSQPNNFGGVSLGRIGEGEGDTIPVEPLDVFHLNRIDLLKIDVEGMERDVLLGATETIARCRPLLYVENDRPEKSAALIETIEALGYTWVEHRPMLYSPENFFKNPHNLFPQIASFNLYCVPR